MYESTPGATVRGIAADLGVERGTSPTADAGRDETPAQRIARLEGRVAQLEVEQVKLVTEREILRQAAKYFAGETNW